MSKLPKNAKEIPGFTSYYATLDGRVWSSQRKGRRCGRFLSPVICKDGYPRVRLSKGGRSYTKKLPTIILETFVGQRPKNMVCRHLDGTRDNSQLDNLQWGTQKENMADTLQHGTSRRGRHSNHTKLNTPQVRIIKRLLESKILTLAEIGRSFGVTKSCIGHISCGNNWAAIS